MTSYMDGHSATGPQLVYIDSFVYFTRFSSEPLGCFRFCSCIKLVTSTVKNFCSRYKLVCPSIYMLAKHCVLAVAFTNQRTMPPVHTFYISNKISFLFSDLYLADSHIYLFFSCPLFLILTDIVTVKVMIKLTLLDAVTSLRGSP
jgi:hypothetical protein